MDFDTFKKERRADAMEAILYDDYKLLSEEIVEMLSSTPDKQEEAIDVVSVGLSLLLAQRDRAVPDEKLDDMEIFFDKVVMSSDFFEGLVEYKLEDMWERGE